MIIPNSQKSESGAPSSSTRSETPFGPNIVPPSPPPYSPTASSSTTTHQDGIPSIRPNLPPRCNYFIDRKIFGGIKGTWHVDTALHIPEQLLLPINQFDGYWNREAQRIRKIRGEELRMRRAQTLGSKTDPSVSLIDTRPNLMLSTTNGAISADVHVLSSDGMHAPPEQPLRIFASTTNGSIDIKIPASFEGALMMSTTWGCVNISEAIKDKLTLFSSASNTCRGFIGNWQAQDFETTSHSNGRNPFATWAGPMIEIASTNGSVSLSFTEEGGISAYIDKLTKSIQGFVDGWFEGGKHESSPSSHLSASRSSQPGVNPVKPKS
ncbi:hypothetical protein RhiTH_003575 [Rhizoctonia solani]